MLKQSMVSMFLLPTATLAQTQVELRVAIGDGVSAFDLGGVVDEMNAILDESADPGCNSIRISNQPLMRFNSGLVPSFALGATAIPNISQLADTSGINVVVARDIGVCGEVKSRVIGCTYQRQPAIVETRGTDSATAELWLHEIFHSYKISWDTDGDEAGGDDEDLAHVNDGQRLMYFALGGRVVTGIECQMVSAGMALFSPRAPSVNEAIVLNQDPILVQDQIGEPQAVETPLEELLSRTWVHGLPFEFLDSTGLEPNALRQELRLIILTSEKWPLWVNALTVLAYVAELNDLNLVRFVLKSDLGSIGVPSQSIVEIKRSAFAAFAYIAGNHGDSDALMEMAALLDDVQASGTPSEIESFASLSGVNEAERRFAQLDMIYGALTATNVIAAANPDLPAEVLANVASLVEPGGGPAPNRGLVALGLSPDFFPQLAEEAIEIQELGLEASVFGNARQ